MSEENKKYEEKFQIKFDFSLVGGFLLDLLITKTKHKPKLVL